MKTLRAFSIELDLQDPNNAESLPSIVEIKTWCEAAIQAETYKRATADDVLSVLIRIVNEEESAGLNQDYREKAGPTNVLSFPNDVPEFMLDIPELNEQNSHLGDLVICDSLMKTEAKDQGKTLLSHWAHLIIHGLLHLQGYDHIDETEAVEMESLEIQIMEQLGFDNPYIQKRK